MVRASAGLRVAVTIGAIRLQVGRIFDTSLDNRFGVIPDVRVTPPLGFGTLPAAPKNRATDILTTADYEGPLKVELPYNPFGLTPEQQKAIKMFRLNDNVWQDVTTGVDPARRVVTGEAAKFSIFGLFVSTAVVAPAPGEPAPLVDNVAPATALRLQGDVFLSSAGAVYANGGTEVVLSAFDLGTGVDRSYYAVDPGRGGKAGLSPGDQLSAANVENAFPGRAPSPGRGVAARSAGEGLRTAPIREDTLSRGRRDPDGLKLPGIGAMLS